jgi:ABC-type transport system involved in multi-copper enzyme maturation permease subunit
MFSLLQIEWLKIKKYPAFWAMLIIVLLTYPAANLMFYNVYLDITTQKGTDMLAKMLLGNPFAFPETWHTVAYISSFFVILPSILVIMLVTNEYQYKTQRQNVIDGWTRGQFMASKLMDVLIVSGITTILYTLVAIGFSVYASTFDASKIWEQAYYIGLFFLQTFAQLSIAFLLGYLIKKAFIALGIFLFYYLIVENIATGYIRMKAEKIGGDLGRFLPFEISDRMIIAPAFIGRFGKDIKTAYEKSLAEVPSQIALSLFLTTAIWAFCFFMHRKKDL